LHEPCFFEGLAAVWPGMCSSAFARGWRKQGCQMKREIPGFWVVWAAPGGTETLLKRWGGFAPCLFEGFLGRPGPPGAAQTPKF